MIRELSTDTEGLAVMMSGPFILSIVVLAIAVVFIALGVAGQILRWFYDPNTPLGFIACVVLLAVAVAVAMFPWPLRYHTWELHSGQVVRVEQRYVTDGSSSVNITREMAFWLSGEKEAYVTDDIRFQGIEAGDTVELRRKADWQRGGEDTWDVIFRDAGK